MNTSLPYSRSFHTRLLTCVAVCILCLGGSQQAKSQAALLALIFGDKVASERFHMSLDAGINFTNLGGIDPGKGNAGLVFGLGTYIKLGNHWALTPEFKPLSFRGARLVEPIKDVSEFLSESNHSLRINYIDIPVLLRYTPKRKLYFGAGPQVSFLNSATQISRGKLPSNADAVVEQSVRSTFKNVHYAFVTEVGYRIYEPVEKKSIDLRLRYATGLSEMIASDYHSTNGGVWQLFVTFPFIKSFDQQEFK